MKRAAMSLVLSGIAFTTTAPLGADESAPRVPADGEPETVVDAWWRLEDCVAALPLPGEGHPSARWTVAARCGRLARIVAQLGDESDRERLWRHYDDAMGRPELRDRFRDALLDWNVAHAIAQLEEGKTRSGPADPIDSTGLEIPEGLARAPSDARQAWRLYVGFVRRAMEDLADVPEDRQLSFQEHPRAFERTISDFLRGRLPASEAARRLERFQWGGGCGCGSGALHDSRTRVLVVAHLQRDRADLAARAAFLPWVDMTGVDELLEDWERRVLQAAGIDWERFALGAIVAGRGEFAADLGRHGSEDAARLLLEVLGVGHPYRPDWRVGDQDEVLGALAAFVTSQGACPGYDSARADDVERASDAPVILADLEERVLEALAERTRPNAGRTEAEAAAHQLLRLCRPESLEAFAQMRLSPFFEVRRRGTLGLRALGEIVSDARAEPPVRFRIVLDGRPLPRTPVETSLALGNGGVRMGTATTTLEGIVHLERDLFLDPRAPVKAVVLSAGGAPGDLRFSTSSSLPEDLGSVTTARVQTGQLTLVLPEWARDEWEKAGSVFMMRRVAQDDDPSGSHSFGWHARIAQSPVVFSRLQHGTYTARVYLPDSTVLEASEVTVSERPATAELEDATPDYSYLELAGP